MKKVIVLISVMCIMVLLFSCSVKTNVYENQINEEGSYMGFDDLPERFTIEEAVLGSDYIKRQSKPYANKQVWDDFYNRSHKGEECNVRMISYHEEDMDHPYYTDIYYNDGLYVIYDSSAEDRMGHRFKYLLTLEGVTGIPSIRMRQVVLADKEDLTFEAYERAMVSSLSTAFDDIGSVRMLMFEVVSDIALINLSYEDPIVVTINFDEEIDSLTHETETNYTSLDNLNSSQVKTIQCDYEFEYGIPPIVEVHPEGYLVGSFKRVDSSDLNSMRAPVILLIDETGEIIWEEIYENSFTTSNMSNLVVYDDGRFLFTLSNWPESSMGSPRSVPSKLIQCNSKGKVNWIKEVDDTIGSVLKFVFLTHYEDIIIVGETQLISSKSGIENIDASDIGFIKLNDEGEEVASAQYGGVSNEYLKSCKYVPGFGVVFTGWTNSKDGEFAKEDRDNQWQDYVAFVNLNLDIEWVNHVETYERFTYDQLGVNGEGIFLLGKSQVNNQLENRLENRQLFIIKYDFTGEEVYKIYCPEHQGFQGVMSVDRYSEVVVGSGNFNKGVLSFYDKYGKKSYDPIEVSYAPQELCLTDNGGFVAKSIREIASIPQPIYISSLWFDHEVVIEKYDEYKLLMWRKVFNDYDDLRIDFVEVFEN